MAVPWINLLAPSMGGIGPIEFVDQEKLGELTRENGIPFYAGRFYPKDSQAILDEFLQLGFFSQTPPWLTWENIETTQIWMVPVFEDERILTMNVTVDRIDLWPRDETGGNETFLPPYAGTDFDELMKQQAWGHSGGSAVTGNLDPGIVITNDVVPPVLFLGYVGISAVSGNVTEWGFYDQELTFINAPQYNMPGLAAGGSSDYEYSEIVRVRGDGIWKKVPADLPEPGVALVIDDSSGYPDGFTNVAPIASYSQVAIDDVVKAATYGNDEWDQITKITDNGLPQVGTFQEIKTSQLDTICITLKVSCTTVILPDQLIPTDAWTGILEYGKVALETFASNLTNNIWYFYWPVRLNGELAAERVEFLLNRAAVSQPGAFE